MEETDNAVSAAQPTGLENGVKRPHDPEAEHDEPGVKKVKIESSLSLDAAVNEDSSETVHAEKFSDESKPEGDVKVTDEPKSDDVAGAAGVTSKHENNDSKSLPRGTAAIKPQ